jgi:ribosome-binding factor A
MKAKKPLRKQMLPLCGEIGPEDGIDPREWVRESTGRKPGRKTQQLCSQVAQTLNFVLAWDSGDDLLRELSVVAVDPAPHPGRLLVTLAFNVPGAGDPQAALVRLQRAQGRLRREVAAAIHRRRVPELVFRIVTPGEASW